MARSVYYFSDSRQRGGAEAALLLLLEHLDRSVWEPTFLYVPSEPLESVAEDARRLDVAVHAVSNLFELTRMLRRQRPSVFHAHLSWPLAARKQLAAAIAVRVPAVVATYQLFPPGSFGRTAPLQGRMLAARIGRGIAVSDAIASALVERLGWPRGKIDVIRNSIPVERYAAASDPELRRALRATRTISSFSRSPGSTHRRASTCCCGRQRRSTVPDLRSPAAAPSVSGSSSRPRCSAWARR